MKLSIFFQKQTQRFQNQMVTTGETIAGREGLGSGNNINTLLDKIDANDNLYSVCIAQGNLNS